MRWYLFDDYDYAYYNVAECIYIFRRVSHLSLIGVLFAVICKSLKSQKMHLFL
jgi:hypothetical protein